MKPRIRLLTEQQRKARQARKDRAEAIKDNLLARQAELMAHIHPACALRN